MKKLMTIAVTTLLISSAAYAGTQTVYSDTHIVTGGFATETEALNAGHDVVDNITHLSSAQLRNKLPTFGDNMVRGVTVDDTEITVEEFSKSRGEVQYRAVVDVEYHYKAHESNDS